MANLSESEELPKEILDTLDKMSADLDAGVEWTGRRNRPKRRLSSDDYMGKAKKIVFDWIKPRLEKTDTHVTFAEDEVYVVWFAKTLQNWKCLISTSLPDGMYYEVTYNGDKHETYLDAYKKFDNVTISDEV